MTNFKCMKRLTDKFLEQVVQGIGLALQALEREGFSQINTGEKILFAIIIGVPILAVSNGS